MDIYYCPGHLRKTQLQTFYYKQILEKPINKGANSNKLKLLKIGNTEQHYSETNRTFFM